jgi:ribosomal-protein-alanine N-acetyltransferase
VSARVLPLPILGERVALRSFRRPDLPRVIGWRNDPEVRLGALWPESPFGAREGERWLRAISRARTRVTLGVELRHEGRLVGLTNLSGIDGGAASAHFGIVVGDKACWGRGIARETLGLMMERAAAMGLRRVVLEVARDNARAVALYEHFGFATDRRVTRRHAGGLIELTIMSLRLPR